MCPYDTKENVTVIKPLRWLAAINMMDIFPYPAKEEEVNAIWKKHWRNPSPRQMKIYQFYKE